MEATAKEAIVSVPHTHMKSECQDRGLPQAEPDISAQVCLQSSWHPESLGVKAKAYQQSSSPSGLGGRHREGRCSDAAEQETGRAIIISVGHWPPGEQRPEGAQGGGRPPRAAAAQ